MTAIFAKLREYGSKAQVIVTTTSQERLRSRPSKVRSIRHAPGPSDANGFTIVITALANSKYTLTNFSINTTNPDTEQWYLPLHKIVAGNGLGIFRQAF